ncbi:TetR/AcrR family transcriptional regulator [Devosia sp.]|uniref:TetR/AcrR family transcriptional regulator n=1 Tax=Devosia sp. TaxID=1871048 RepID=UPI0039C87017
MVAMNASSSTVDDILACARSLIADAGYNGFSYADIADVVGIRKASIHHHFPSKVDLVRTLVERYREDARAGFDALERTASDPRQQLLNYVAYWERCLAEASTPFCICALLASELPALPPEVAAEIRLHFEALSKWLSQAFARGEIQGIFRLRSTPDNEAEAFMAAVHGGMLSARVHENPKLFTAVAASALAHLAP